jgi:hypothetical protein
MHATWEGSVGLSTPRFAGEGLACGRFGVRFYPAITTLGRAAEENYPRGAQVGGLAGPGARPVLGHPSDPGRGGSGGGRRAPCPRAAHASHRQADVGRADPAEPRHPRPSCRAQSACNRPAAATAATGLPADVFHRSATWWRARRRGPTTRPPALCKQGWLLDPDQSSGEGLRRWSLPGEPPAEVVLLADDVEDLPQRASPLPRTSRPVPEARGLGASVQRRGDTPR